MYFSLLFLVAGFACVLRALNGKPFFSDRTAEPQTDQRSPLTPGVDQKMYVVAGIILLLAGLVSAVLWFLSFGLPR